MVAVAGDVADRLTFYFGACAGGVWKTVDGGITWRNISDGKTAVGVRETKVRRRHYLDDRGHVRMDIAVDVDDSR